MVYSVEYIKLFTKTTLKVPRGIKNKKTSLARNEIPLISKHKDFSKS